VDSQRAVVWSTVLTLAVAVLVVAGLTMVAGGRLRVDFVGVLAIAAFASLLGAVLRYGPLRGLGTTLTLVGPLLVLLVIATFVFAVVFVPFTGY
jgi:hypothetical protein